MKARLVLKPEEALLEPTAIMGDEEGIYFTFMSDLGVISSVLPEPLEPAFPLVSGGLMILIGGVLFLISDLILSGTYFGKGKDRPAQKAV